MSSIVLPMIHNGPSFYNDEAIFATYMGRRKRPNNPNDTIEKPIFLELLGDVSGLRILDLGCGDARFANELLEKECHSYVGLEGSQKMVQAARERLDDSRGTIIHTTLEAWEYPVGAFDLVLSRLVLHYIEDLVGLLANLYRTLAAGGRFVFSVEHPLLTCSTLSDQQPGKRSNRIVDEYFIKGARVVPWMGSEVIMYHRTIEEYYSGLQQAGFTIQQLRESRPRREQFSDVAEYQRRLRIPLFLFFATAPHPIPY